MKLSDESLNGERREENNGLNRSIETSSTDHSGSTAASSVFLNTPPARITRRRSLNDISAVDLGLQLNNLIRPRRCQSESVVDEWNTGIEEFREWLCKRMCKYGLPRYVLRDMMGTPSTQSEASTPHADSDRDSNSDLSTISGSTTDWTLTRDPRLAGHKFYFPPDMHLDSEGNESPSDGSSSEEE